MKILLKIILAVYPIILIGQTTEVNEAFRNDEFFNENIDTIYPIYQGNLIKSSNREYNYGNRTIFIDTNDQNIDVLRTIIENRVFNPDVIFGKEPIQIDTLYYSPESFSYSVSKFDTIFVCCISELKSNLNDVRRKRFHFLVAETDVLNPYEFYIELFYSEATKETSIEEFLEKAKLVYFYNAGLII